MVEDQILKNIWSGTAYLRGAEERSPLAALLDSILSVPTISMVVASGVSKPLAYADSFELLPGCVLGDIISEEFGVDLPLNCIILVEPQDLADAQTTSTRELGQNLGLALSSIVGSVSQASSNSALQDQNEMHVTGVRTPTIEELVRAQ